MRNKLYDKKKKNNQTFGDPTDAQHRIVGK
jgi:hypothetical protein